MPVVSITVPEGDDFNLRLVELLKQAIEVEVAAPKRNVEMVPPYQPPLPINRPKATPKYNQAKTYQVKHPATDLLLARHRQAITDAARGGVHPDMVRNVLDVLAMRYGMDQFRITGVTLAKELGYTLDPVERAMTVLHKVGILKFVGSKAIRRIDWMA